MKKITCHCGSRKTREDCCLPFLTGTSKPETPEQLMRSRYSAFCVRNIDYLMATRHSSGQQPDEREVLGATVQETQWLGLKVMKTGRDGSDQDVGYVEFSAFYKNTGIGQHHENSRFIRENGQWYYVDGVMLEPVKFGRNDPCWCGSDKKHKKCHGQ